MRCWFFGHDWEEFVWHRGKYANILGYRCRRCPEDCTKGLLKPVDPPPLVGIEPWFTVVSGDADD